MSDGWKGASTLEDGRSIEGLGICVELPCRTLSSKRLSPSTPMACTANRLVGPVTRTYCFRKTLDSKVSLGSALMAQETWSSQLTH